MFILSYQGPKFTNVTVVKVANKGQGEDYTATLLDDGTGVDVYVNNAEDLKLERSALNILYNALAETPVKKFDSQTIACTRLFALLCHVAKDWDPTSVPQTVEPKDTNTAPGEFSPPDSAPAEEELSPADPEATALADTYNKEADMVKAKKKAKAKKAPKVSKPKAEKGLPREGSKKAELLRLLQRKTGATMKEMLDATGWKACLGTAKAVTTAAKLKFRHEKGEGDKPSRWYAE